MVHGNHERHNQKGADPCKDPYIIVQAYTLKLLYRAILTKCSIFLTKTGANDVIQKIQAACHCSFTPLGFAFVPQMSTSSSLNLPSFLPTHTFRLPQLSALDQIIYFSSALCVCFSVVSHCPDYKGHCPRLCLQRLQRDGNADSMSRAATSSWISQHFSSRGREGAYGRVHVGKKEPRQYDSRQCRLTLQADDPHCCPERETDPPRARTDARTSACVNTLG